MSPEIKIRKACHDDIDILVLNNVGLANDTEGLTLDKNVLEKGIKQALERAECHYFVGEIAGKVVGQTMITYEWSDWRNGVIWWMQSVYVIPKYRKQGVFKSLFKHIENLARNNGQVKALRLYVRKNNKVGQNTYTSLEMNDSGYIVFEKEKFLKN
jgi:ribosomal protein S18 acetylase RimI-like enzyme